MSKLYNYKTLSTFESDLSSGNVKETDICFIEDSSLIWTHNKFYGLNTELKSLLEQVKTIDEVYSRTISKICTLLGFNENLEFTPESSNFLNLNVTEAIDNISNILPTLSGVGKVYKGSNNGEIFNDYSYNTASGEYAHSEGYVTKAPGNYSHAEGYRTDASGGSSHSEGSYTMTSNEAEHALGLWNKSNTGDTDDLKTIHSIGIGNWVNDERKNALEVMRNGDYYIVGIGNYDGTNPAEALTLLAVIDEFLWYEGE